MRNDWMGINSGGDWSDGNWSQIGTERVSVWTIEYEQLFLDFLLMRHPPKGGSRLDFFPGAVATPKK